MVDFIKKVASIAVLETKAFTLSLAVLLVVVGSGHMR